MVVRDGLASIVLLLFLSFFFESSWSILEPCPWQVHGAVLVVNSVDFAAELIAVIPIQQPVLTRRAQQIAC